MKCPYCTATIPDAARKCMHCGEWLDPTQRKREERMQKEARLAYILTAAVLAFVIGWFITKALLAAFAPLPVPSPW